MTNQDSNLTKHRKAVVSAVCEALAACISGQSPGTEFRAEFDGESLRGFTLSPKKIIAIADTCDGILIQAKRKGGDENSPRAFVSIIWGNGVGCCISDYSAWLDGNPNWQPVLDFTEFLEI